MKIMSLIKRGWDDDAKRKKLSKLFVTNTFEASTRNKEKDD